MKIGAYNPELRTSAEHSGCSSHSTGFRTYSSELARSARGKLRAAHPTLNNKRPPRRNAKWRAAARGPLDWQIAWFCAGKNSTDVIRRLHMTQGRDKHRAITD